MTAFVFVLALLLAWLHWTLAEPGWLLWGNVSIYVAASIATLSAASVAALVSRDTRCLVAALVLIVNFTGSHYAWQTDDPILAGTVNDLITAAYFALTARLRWEFGISAIYLVSVASGIMTQLGYIPNHLERAPNFVSWSYPDIVALLAHAANVTLGLGAGDAGLRLRIPLDAPMVGDSVGHRLVARLRALAKVAQG